MRTAVMILVGVAIGFLLGAGTFELINRDSSTALKAAESRSEEATAQIIALESKLASLTSERDASRRAATDLLADRDETIRKLSEDATARQRRISELELELGPPRDASRTLTAPRSANNRRHSAPSGNVKGGDFNVDNLSWRVADHGTVEFQGELENLASTGWKTSIFQVAAYDEDGDLLATTMFFVNQFPLSDTKAFSGRFSDPFETSSSIDLRFSFEGGVEDE